MQTRARLVDAALAVFTDVGFLDARITDIAERAGISHGSFYHYFDSKEAVFREVAEAMEARLTAPAETEEPAESELERIRRANRRYLERYRENGRIMGVIEEVSRHDEFVSDARNNRQRHLAQRAEENIRRLQRAGLADTALDPAVASTALGAMVARFAELWFVERWAEYDFEQAVEQLTRLWANAIGLTY